MKRRRLTALAIAAALALGGVAGFGAPPCAEANACAASCYSDHNQCRMATKGSPSCDRQLTSCLRACNARR